MKRTASGPSVTTRSWLARAAAEAGQKWADSFRTDLIRDGRVPSGGWPGTLTEARTVAAAYLRRGVPDPRVRTLSSLELDGFARMVNACARQGWLAQATRDSAEPFIEGDPR